MKTYELTKITTMSVHDRPREKIMNRGAEALSDMELMAILIGSGSRHNPVEKLAGKALQLVDGFPGVIQAEDFLSIDGIGPAKATLLAASMELSRRIYSPRNRKISTPGDIYPLLSHYGDRQQEYFFSISLNGAHEVIDVKTVSKGILNRAIIHPREVFADAITLRAASLVVAHNHPSGNLEPSKEDREITYRLQEAGVLLGIELLDHIVFSHKGYFSFLEEGEI
ncbi:MAG: DNA repair protein RadC [Spirochaetales bacterium]|nr:DNA repair protein RadC [Spirochaetales bacterium]